MDEPVSKSPMDGNGPIRQVRQFTNFDAGKSGRRLRAIPTTTDAINSQIRKYGANVLARSRHLCANNAYAASAKEAFITALVGHGIKPSSLMTENPTLKKAIQLAWFDWTDEADADWLTDFYGMQALVAGELFEAGEIFVRFRPRRVEDGLLVPMQLQLLPAEMLPLSNYDILGSRSRPGSRIECGIEFDAIGRRRAYHFLRQHPGDMFRFTPGPGMTTVVPADEVLHIYSPMRAGQIRGVPHSLSGITTLALLDLYDDAELERKRTAALFAGFVTKNGSDTHPLGEGGMDEANAEEPGYNPIPPGSVGLEPGAMVDLEPGEDVKFSAPADVGGNFEAFEYRTLLRAAAGFGIPYADMTGDMKQVNYSSLRAGLVQFRRRINRMQHHLIVYQFCRPVWNRFIHDAAQAGAVEGLTYIDYLSRVRDLRRVKWIPPKWEWIDPLKDRQGEELAVKNKWKSRDDVIEEEGLDPEEVDARIAASTARLEELGLSGQAPGGDAEISTGDEPEEPTGEEIPDEPPERQP